MKTILQRSRLLLPMLAMTMIASVGLAKDMVTFETLYGNITVEVYPEKAPVTVANFMSYVEDGSYKGTIFHRVIPGFMIQGGGLDLGLRPKSTRAPIKIESNNGLKNLRGTIAMARTGDPNSATNQFFINLVDNSFLDFKDETALGYGYTVFGKVTAGMDVVDAIAKAKTTNVGSRQNVPVEPIVIKNVTFVKGKK